MKIFLVLLAATAGGRAAASRPCLFEGFKDPANDCVCDSLTVPLDKTMNEAHLDSRVFEFGVCSQLPFRASTTSSLTSTTSSLTSTTSSLNFVRVTYDARNGSGQTSPEGKLLYTAESYTAPGFLAQNSWTNSAGQKRYCPDIKGNWAHPTLDSDAITFNSKTNEFDYDFESVCSHVDGIAYPNMISEMSEPDSSFVGTQRVALAYGWCKNHWLSAVSAVTTNHSTPNDPKMTTVEYGPFTPSWMECPRNTAPCDAQDSDCICSVLGLRATYQCNPTTGPPTCAVKGVTSSEECGIACEKSGFEAGWGWGPDCVCRDDQNDEEIICQEPEPEPEPSAPSPISNEKGLTIGVEIAIVAASLVAVAGFLLLLYRRRKTQQRREERENENVLLNSDYTDELNSV